MKNKTYFVFFAVLAVVALGFSACNNPSLPLVADRDVPENGLNEALNWVYNSSRNNGTYNLKLSGDQEINSFYLSFNTIKNVTVTLSGVGGVKTIKLVGDRAHFGVAKNSTLILEENITLLGHVGNTESLVVVNNGGMFVINDGARITGNDYAYMGSGIFVWEGGTVIMNGGEISEHTAGQCGGGIYVWEGGIFEMNGGTITGNIAKGGGGSGGGGVLVSGTFRMNGGFISKNDATIREGGGVLVNTNGKFYITNGIIWGEGANANTASVGSVLSNTGLAQFGIGDTWFPLATTNTTIEVIDGVKQ